MTSGSTDTSLNHLHPMSSTTAQVLILSRAYFDSFLGSNALRGEIEGESERKVHKREGCTRTTNPDDVARVVGFEAISLYSMGFANGKYATRTISQRPDSPEILEIWILIKPLYLRKGDVSEGNISPS